MSYPVGRAVRYRSTLSLSLGQEVSVQASLHEGQTRVHLHLSRFVRRPKLRRSPLGCADLTLQQAKRLRAMLGISIEAAEAARESRTFDPDQAEQDAKAISRTS